MLERIEPLVPKSYSDYLLELTTHRATEFPWFYNENISGEDGNQKMQGASNKGFQYGFFHVLYHNEEILSPFYKDFLPLLYFMEDKTGVKINQLYRLRAAMNTWSPQETQHHAHVDMQENHKVLLYYVNDSDGDTFMYNEIHEVGEEPPLEFTLHSRHTPKQGDAVLFDGLRYHSSSKPQNHAKRVIVNIDFI